jgi:hypothetical protein
MTDVEEEVTTVMTEADTIPTEAVAVVVVVTTGEVAEVVEVEVTEMSVVTTPGRGTRLTQSSASTEADGMKRDNYGKRVGIGKNVSQKVGGLVEWISPIATKTLFQARACFGLLTCLPQSVGRRVSKQFYPERFTIWQMRAGIRPPIHDYIV